MKKSVLLLFFFFSFSLFAQTLPENLCGIWEGKDRLVFFNQDSSDFVLVLKTYYGWYYDRAAENEGQSEQFIRQRNSATTKKATEIKYSYVLQNEKQYLDFKFNKTDEFFVPFLEYKDNIYLDFAKKNQSVEYQALTDNKYDFFEGDYVSSGFLMSNQEVPENLSGFLIDEDKIFNIRYWKTDMDYSPDFASFTYKNKSYSVPRHIISGNCVFSCVNGRSNSIRNLQPPLSFSKEDYFFTDDENYLIFDKAPYLTKIADKNTFEELVSIVNKANSRRKPDPSPLFPEENLNFYWDLIDELEKDNELIKQVRLRQEQFGPRGKDLNR